METISKVRRLSIKQVLVHPAPPLQEKKKINQLGTCNKTKATQLKRHLPWGDHKDNSHVMEKQTKSHQSNTGRKTSTKSSWIQQKHPLCEPPSLDSNMHIRTPNSSYKWLLLLKLLLKLCKLLKPCSTYGWSGPRVGARGKKLVLFYSSSAVSQACAA